MSKSCPSCGHENAANAYRCAICRASLPANAIETAKRFEDLLELESHHAPYVFDRIFSDEDRGARSLSKKKFKLLKRIDGEVRAMLEDDEKVHRITSGMQTSVIDELFLNFVSPINRYALVFTDRRLLPIQIGRGDKPSRRRSQIRYEAIESIGSTPMGNLRIVFKGGEKATFSRVHESDRGLPEEAVGRFRAGITASAPDADGKEDLCPHCYQRVTGTPTSFPTCQGGFKSARKAGLLSLIFPGFGDFYLGHRGTATLEIVAASFIWLSFLGPGDVQLAQLLFLLAVVHGGDAVLTRRVARKGIYPSDPTGFSLAYAVLLVPLLLVPALISGISTSESAEQHFTAAVELQKQGQLEEAIAEYGEAIRLNPQAAEAYFNRGNSFKGLGQYQRAIADYDETIRLEPQLPTAYNNRGNSFLGLGQYQRAIADYDEAIRIDPELANAYVGRGGAYNDLGEFQRAIADLNEAIELEPQLADAYNNRGNSFSGLGQYQCAVADLNEAIRLNPEDSVAYYNRGLNYSRLGQSQRAIAEYDEAIRIDPEFANVYANRALEYTILREDVRAEHDTNRAVELGFDPAVLKMAIAEVRAER